MPEGEWVAVALLGKARGNRGEVPALALGGKPERYQATRWNPRGSITER